MLYNIDSIDSVMVRIKEDYHQNRDSDHLRRLIVNNMY